MAPGWNPLQRYLSPESPNAGQPRQRVQALIGSAFGWKRVMGHELEGADAQGMPG